MRKYNGCRRIISFAAYSCAQCAGSVARRATLLIFSRHIVLSTEIVMASSSKTSMVSKSACTVLSHEDLGRPLGCFHSTGTLATRRLRTSELRHPYNMSEERETSPLDDGGQRQGAGPMLNLHVGDEIRPPNAADTS